MALHWYTLSSLLLIESKARRAELETLFPSLVVHSYCAEGFEVTEQLMYNCSVSFIVILVDALNVGVSISEKACY